MSIKKNNEYHTSFGFKDVSRDEKDALVAEVFNNVAPNYDLMNDLMSLGLHRLWKSRLIEKIRPSPTLNVLDVGGGTGDLPFKFLEMGGKEVVVADINQKMLVVGRGRALNRALIDEITWVCANAEELPIDDASFDCYVTAFCFRNVTNLDRALKEAHRVLKPGGKFLCLEFSQVVIPQLAKLYDIYSFNFLPFLGQMVSKDRTSYQYLVESIRRFPHQDEFLAQIEDSGLVKASYENILGGITAIHSAWKI